MINTRRLGMLAIRSATPRRVSVLSLHTSALLLRTPGGSFRSRNQGPSERLRGGVRRPLFPKQVSAAPTVLQKRSPAQVRAALLRDVEPWTHLKSTMAHIAALGIPKDLSKDLLSIFHLTVRDELQLLNPDEPQSDDALWNLDRIADDMYEDMQHGTQRTLMIRFLNFAITQLESPPYKDNASMGELLFNLQAIRKATDLRRMIEWYPLARSMRRKIIMHVGPTNSGKTYNALQALAGAASGVYAGPLRLLAHEVWQRINKGSIAPKKLPHEATEPEKGQGIVDLDDAAPVAVTTELSPDSPPIVNSIPAVPPPPRAYEGRPCNLLTGEEQRIVSPNATAVACTVEMIPKHLLWDVGVIDEIQMLADQHRGGAWTSALLGVAARELHLCGEDTVVDLVRALCAMTGDELIVNRYERLTPLEISAESLQGNLKNVERGDCVVTFARNEIFMTKRKIEQATGLRCAVVYGRLPPEVRSEQAQLFNAEESGYDVIVASDSVGMGLNLKIKRVVFMRTEKWDGTKDVALPIPLIKQIAGRAGRFGLLKSKSSKQHYKGKKNSTPASVAEIAASQPPGLVSALWPSSLQRVHEAMSTPNPTVRHARVDIANPNTDVLALALPSGTGVTDLLDTMRLIAQLPPMMKLCVPNIGPTRDVDSSLNSDSSNSPVDVSAQVDLITKPLPLSERLVFANAPVRWRDPYSKAAALSFFRAYESHMHVNLRRETKGLELLEALDEVKELKGILEKTGKFVSSRKFTEWREGKLVEVDAFTRLDQTTLQRLESLHSTLVLYMWLSYRLPLGFYQAIEAEDMKNEVEKGIEWCLEKIRAYRSKGSTRGRNPETVAGTARPSDKERPERQIRYLNRDAVDQWKSRGSTTAAWDHMLKNKPRQATG